MSNLPAEVLNQIFESIKQPLRENTYLPQFPLTPLIRVCKKWQPVAERLLYQSIAIGSNFSHFTDFYYEDIYQLFERSELTMKERMRRMKDTLESLNATTGSNGTPKARSGRIFIKQLLGTLEDNRKLAGLVVGLRIFGSSNGNDVTVMQNSARVVSACPNVRYLEIRCESIHPLAQEILLDALSSVSLVSFKLCSIRSDMGLCTVPDLLRLLTNWPQIEHVQLSPRSLLHNCSNDDDNNSLALEQRCTKLHTFDMGLCEAVLQKPDLRRLLHLCPAGMRTFNAPLALDPGMVALLCECLVAWGETLEVLDIRGGLQAVSQTDVFSKLKRLRHLRMDNFIVGPHLLSDLPRLSDLKVVSASRAERKALLLLLKDPKKFIVISEVTAFRRRLGEDSEMEDEPMPPYVS